jgi:iron-sulfur cluster assembly protein
MTEQTNTEESVISVTPGAIAKIKGLIAEKNLEGYGLRVFVAGGGCSGLQYGMAFENNFLESDRLVDIDGVKIVIDRVSLDYLHGASIDFVDNLMGGGFRIDNPNAAATCGCGNSFRTSGQAGHDTARSGGCGCH